MAKKKITLEEKLEEAIVKDVPYEIPRNWVWVKLGDYIDYATDYVANGSFASLKANVQVYKDENFALMVKTKDFSNNFEKDLTYTDEKGYEFLAKSKLFGGELILSNVGSIGKVFRVPYLDKPMTLASNSIMIKCHNELDYDYLYYLLLSPAGYDLLMSITTGTAVMKFNKTGLKLIPIPIPPLEEQQRIVDKIESLFEKLDKAKELIEEAREDFEKRKSAILEKAFRGELTREWRENNKVAIYGVKYLNEISQMRKEMFKKLLDDSKTNRTKRPTRIHDVSTDYVQHESCDTWIKTKLGNVLYDFRYGTSSKSDYSFKGMPVIRIPNLSNGYINHEDMKYLKEEDVDINNKVKVGDLLIVRSNGSAALVGKTSLITEKEDEFAFASYLIRMRPCKVDTKYLYYVLNSISVKEQFYSKSKSTSGINNINTEELGNSIISLPPLEEQKEIVMILDKILEEEDKIEELIALEEQIELIKKSILVKAFRGELRTNCEDDESALKLLKEILSKK